MRVFLASIVAACATLPALAEHNHITVDTASGTPGEPLLIRVGYLGGETAFSVDVDGRLLHDGEIHEYLLTQPLSGGFEGWTGGDEMVLTSDFYFATGRLDGAFVQYEIVEVVSAHDHSTEFALGTFGTGGAFNADGVSDGATREERSFASGVAGHVHAQGMAVLDSGAYDIHLVAWDSNGIFSDSAPLIVRISTGTSCSGDLNGDTVVDLSDIGIVLADWGCSGHGCAGDADGSEIVDLSDLGIVLAAFGVPCL